MNDITPSVSIAYAAWFISRTRITDHAHLLERSLLDFPVDSDRLPYRSQTIEIACEILALRGYIVFDKERQPRCYIATHLLQPPNRRRMSDSRIGLRSSGKDSRVVTVPLVMAAAAITASCSLLPADQVQTIDDEPPKTRKLTLIENPRSPSQQYLAQHDYAQRPATWVRLGGASGSNSEVARSRATKELNLPPLSVIHLGQTGRQRQEPGPVAPHIDGSIAKKTPYIDGPNYFASAALQVEPKVQAHAVEDQPKPSSRSAPPPVAAATQTAAQPKPLQLIPSATVAGITEKSVEAMALAAAKAALGSSLAEGGHDEAPAPSAPTEFVEVQARTGPYIERGQAEQKTVSQPEGTAEAQIEAFLEKWTDDWMSKDAEATLAHYAASFQPHRMSRVDWETWRRKALARDGDIELSYDIRKITVSGERAAVLIWQSYKSPYFRSRIGKQLALVKQGQNWLIHREIVKESMR